MRFNIGLLYYPMVPSYDTPSTAITISTSKSWAWLHRLSLCLRILGAFVNRHPLPRFVLDSLKAQYPNHLVACHRLMVPSTSSPEVDYANPDIFGPIEDAQLVEWVRERPEDWESCWPFGKNQIWAWGHNHRGQLGGVGGVKVKTPTNVERLGELQPLQVIGGEQSLFVVTNDGEVYASGSYTALDSIS
ncbi:unnamed protein product [Protopolystoma xenopodis]|uniref:Uncharacterized protein n=1 Tax=Protopolystoma xenopodis TaxID=117903 RepID=A0A448XAM9_9PLAT|nr:unnamed protein product [Protopolystoma xenopodis]